MKLLDAAALRLSAAGVESPRKEARLLLAYVLGMTPERIIAEDFVPLDARTLAAFDAALDRRVAREPLAYITGRREFWSLDFMVTPGVLVPRPETETLIEEALRRFAVVDASLSVLDLGTGTGCLLLAFLSERPSATGYGVDKAEAAVKAASANAAALGLASRAQILRGDWNDAPGDKFDVVFSNPPYIRASDFAALAPEVALHEPKEALLAGDDGLEAYRSLMPAIAARLKPGGLAFVELGQGQAEAAIAIAGASGLSHAGTATDLAGISRCLVLASR